MTIFTGIFDCLLPLGTVLFLGMGFVFPVLFFVCLMIGAKPNVSVNKIALAALLVVIGPFLLTSQIVGSDPNHCEAVNLSPVVVFPRRISQNRQYTYQIVQDPRSHLFLLPGIVYPGIVIMLPIAYDRLIEIESVAMALLDWLLIPFIGIHLCKLPQRMLLYFILINYAFLALLFPYSCLLHVIHG